jgi:pilus assembly protein CpaE
MIRVAIADHLQTTVRSCASLLGLEPDIEVCGTAQTKAGIMDIAAHHHPDIVILDTDEPGIDGLTAAREIHRIAPDVAIIATSANPDPAAGARAALQAGARECLAKPITADLLVGSVHRVYAVGQRRDEYLRHSVGMKAAQTERQARLIVVIGSQGGCGKSVLAASLAVLLAKRTRQRVGLMDLDLQLGDMGFLFNINTRLTIAELARVRSDQIDAERLEDAMVDGPQGLRMLLAPRTPDLADAVRMEVVETVIQRLRTSFDWLVVDTPAGISDTTWEALRQAYRCVLVTTPQLTSVKGCRLLLEYLVQRDLATDRVLVVANSVAPDPDQADRYLESIHRALTVRLPYDPETVRRSVDKGVPFALQSPGTPIGMAVRDLVECLLQEAPVAVGAA